MISPILRRSSLFALIALWPLSITASIAQATQTESQLPSAPTPSAQTDAAPSPIPAPDNPATEASPRTTARHPHTRGQSSPNAFPGSASRTSASSFDWSHFLTGVTQTGFRYVTPRFSTASQGGSPFSDASSTSQGFAGRSSSMDGLSAGPSSFTANDGTGTRGTMGGGRAGGVGGSGRGGGSMFSLGDQLLRGAASSSNGALGESLSDISRVASLPASGMQLTDRSSGLDLRLSTNLSSMLGSYSRFAGGAGAGSFGASGNGSAAGGFSSANATNTFSPTSGTNNFNGPGHGGGGHSATPSVSLNLKF